jgi:hypothetical protein
MTAAVATAALDAFTPLRPKWAHTWASMALSSRSSSAQIKAALSCRTISESSSKRTKSISRLSASTLPNRMGKTSSVVIILMNPGPFIGRTVCKSLILVGVARRGGSTNHPSPGGSSSRPMGSSNRPMVARLVSYGPDSGETKEKSQLF